MAEDPREPTTNGEEAWLSEALGQLAGGMAHDLNNLLTATLAHADLLAEALAAGDMARVRGELDEVRRTSSTSSRMVKHLLSFSRGERLRPRPVELDDAVDDALRLVRPLLPSDVSLETDLSHGPTVLADTGAIEKMLVTLAANAREAMSAGGGRLEIHVAEGGLGPEHFARTGWGDAGEYGVVTVRDTGRGMAPETVARLFRPFFEERRGQEDPRPGLTMSMVYGMMKQMRGFIEVESEEETGTTVRLYFRLADARSSDGTTADAAGTGARRTVLVVEDDESLLRVTARILRNHGYRTIEAEDGQVALDVIRREGLPDLLVSDLVMPSMTGIELLRHLEEEGTLPPVLLTSGFRPEFLLDWHRDPAAFPFLEKPWSVDDLLSQVGELVQGPPAKE